MTIQILREDYFKAAELAAKNQCSLSEAVSKLINKPPKKEIKEVGTVLLAGTCNICGKPLEWNLSLPADKERVEKLLEEATGNRWQHAACRK